MLDRAAEADVVALQLNGGTWPEGRAGWLRRVRELWAPGAFHEAFCQGRTVVLRQGAGEGLACPAWKALVEAPLTPSEEPEPEEVPRSPKDLRRPHRALSFPPLDAGPAAL